MGLTLENFPFCPCMKRQASQKWYEVRTSQKKTLFLLTRPLPFWNSSKIKWCMFSYATYWICRLVRSSEQSYAGARSGAFFCQFLFILSFVHNFHSKQQTPIINTIQMIISIFFYFNFHKIIRKRLKWVQFH